MLQRILLLSLVLITGCSPDSLDDYQKEGQAICRILSKELRTVQTRDDLLKSEVNLKKKFDDLVELIMQAKVHQMKHHDECSFAQEDQNPFSEELLYELKRIYAQIEGGREIVERAQKEALFRLDGFIKKMEKQKKIRPV